MDDITSLSIKVDSTQVKQGAAALNDLGKAGGAAETGVKKVESSSSAMSKSLQVTKIAALGVATALTAISVAALAVSGKALKDFAAYEKALVGVQKTTDLSAKEMEVLKKSIQGLSREFPIATTDLLAISEAAGQLGVKGVDNISKFAEVMGKLQLATDVVGEEGAKQIARLLTITGEGVGVIDNFGAVLVALGNNAAASESEILSLGSEIGQATSVFKLSANQAIALAASMKELGVRSELGGSVVGRAMREIDSAINEGGESMELLSKMTGILGKDLKKTFEDDAAGVFQAWLKGVGGMIKSGASATDILDQFNLKGEEVLKVLPTMAVNYSTVTKSMKIMTDEQEKATALNDEAAKASDTLSAQYGILLNILNEISVSIGEDLAPMVKQLIADFKDWWEVNDIIVKQDLKTLFYGVGEAVKFMGEMMHGALTYYKAFSVNQIVQEIKSLEVELSVLQKGYFGKGGFGTGTQEEIDAVEKKLALVRKQLEFVTAATQPLKKEYKELGDNYREMGNQSVKVTDKIVDGVVAETEAAKKLREELEKLAEEEAKRYAQSVFDTDIKIAAMNGIAAAAKAQTDTFVKLEEIKANSVEKTTEDLLAQVEAMRYITTFSGQSFGNEVADGINRAALSVSKMNTMFEDQIKVQDKIQKQRKEITETTLLDAEQKKKALSELDALESSMITDQLGGYSNMFGTIGQLFKENSKEREAMHTLEMGFAAAEIAINLQKALTNAVVAITNQGSGDPYTAFARIAAMVALMGGIVGMIGGSLSGGSGGNNNNGSSSTTGTVFGDPSATSSSLNNATDLLSDFEEKQYTELRAIHHEMVSLNSNITGLVTGIIRETSSKNTFGNKNLVSGDDGTQLGNLIHFALDPVTGTISKILDQVGIGFGQKLSDFMGKTLGNIFGGNVSSSVKEQGYGVNAISVQDLLEGQQVQAYEYQKVKIKKDGGWFGNGSSSNKTYTQAASEDMNRLFTQVFSDMGESLVELTKGLGGDLSEALSYAFSIPRLDLKGKSGDEITEALQGAISTAFDNAADTILGDLVGKYQQASEGMFETAVRVYTGQVVVLDALGKTGNKTSGDILELTQAIIDLAGGTDEFVAAFENYIDLFSTENEKLSASFKFITESLSEFNFVLPSTRKGFTDLISSLDVTTESGKEAYVALLGLADGADQLYSAIEDIMTEVTETITKSGMSDAEEKIFDLTKKYDEYIQTLAASGAALSDVMKAEQARAIELKALASDLIEAIKSQVDGYANAVKSAEDNIQNAYSSALSKRDAAQEKVNGLLEKSSVDLENFSNSIDSFLESLDLKTLESSFDNLVAQFMVTSSAAAAGDADAMNNLLTQANSVLSVAEKNSGSKLEYDKIVAMVRSQVEMVQDSISPEINNELVLAQKELSDATSELTQFEILAIKAGVTLQTSAEQTADLLNELDEAYTTAFVNNINAQREYQTALSLTSGLTFETANSLAELISNVDALSNLMTIYANPNDPNYSQTPMSSFAVGTDYVPADMTARIHQGERIVPAAYNRSDKTNAELLAEIQKLRTEMNAVMYQVAKNTLKTADYAERQDGSILKVTIAESTTSITRETQVVGSTIGESENQMLQESGTIASQEDGSEWTQEG